MNKTEGSFSEVVLTHTAVCTAAFTRTSCLCSLGGLLMVHFKERYLVQSEEAEVTDDAERTDPRPRGDLTCYLQANLHNLQRVGEDNLGASSLN